VIGYDDDDGDEFGLPSLSSMKRRTRKTQATQDGGDSMTLSPSYGGSADLRRYSNSADIAVERPAPSYPMPKKSEGKILRPQYKEILRGLSSLRRTAGEQG
jgi:TBC1 domain family member 2